MKLIIRSQTSTVQPLRFGNVLMISSYTLLDIWLSLQWCHNEHDSVSNHQRLDFLLNRLFRRWSKKTSKFSVTSFVKGIHRWPHKGPVMRKMFSFDESSWSSINWNSILTRSSECFATHYALNKMADILQTTISNAFLEWKYQHFDLNFTGFCS